jgi:hypothetical protein
MKYRTGDDPTNHYTTHAVCMCWLLVFVDKYVINSESKECFTQDHDNARIKQWEQRMILSKTFLWSWIKHSLLSLFITSIIMILSKTFFALTVYYVVVSE